MEIRPRDLWRSLSPKSETGENPAIIASGSRSNLAFASDASIFVRVDPSNGLQSTR
jgi:hypothetical protein